ncbi:hypothetical protein LXA43DRAFT_235684 [Ganoderma leucocontextum]|nr:hypothetical protein LXA43DRAFT_235684 [Ganoderma leucocontextum]
MDSISEGRYAGATSGVKTYDYGCFTHIGITLPGRHHRQRARGLAVGHLGSPHFRGDCRCGLHEPREVQDRGLWRILHRRYNGAGGASRCGRGRLEVHYDGETMTERQVGVVWINER